MAENVIRCASKQLIYGKFSYISCQIYSVVHNFMCRTGCLGFTYINSAANLSACVCVRVCVGVMSALALLSIINSRESLIAIKVKAFSLLLGKFLSMSLGLTSRPTTLIEYVVVIVVVVATCDMYAMPH